MNGIEYLGAAELARRYRDRSLSPVEVTRALLDRIGRLDPVLGAFVHVAAVRALDDARHSEAAVAAGRPRGPLEGVPVVLKDLLDASDMPTAAGSRVIGRLPARDAAVVARLRAAGAVLLGKVGLHELAFGVTGVNPHFPPCRNPWDRERVPGGSSSGSAVALAAGLAPLAIGTDTGGSIRIPSSACGVVGLKPTFGAVGRSGLVPLAWSLDHVGPMARSVADAALLFDAIAGHDRDDPWSAAHAHEPAGRTLGAGVRGLRLGVLDASAAGAAAGVDDEVGAAVEAALGVLSGLGARTVPVAVPPLEPIYTATFALIASEAGGYHRRRLADRPADFGEDVRRNLAIGLCLSAADVIAARRAQGVATAALLRAFDDVDAVVLPTLPRTALRRSDPVSREPREAWNRLVVPFNLTGLPALSLPAGFDRAGLPIGLQVAGRPFDEATILRVAAAYEGATDWHTRRPPLQA